MPFLGTSYDDPQTQGILSLAGQMIRGDLGGGLLSYAEATSPQNRLKADLMRAQIDDTSQQIGLRNIQLRQQQAQWDMLAPLMRAYSAGASGQGGGQGGAIAASGPSTPAIAPSPGGPLGSGTFGMSIGGQQASAPPATAGVQTPAPAGQGGGMFGVPYSVGAPVLMFGGPQKFAETVSSYNAPNDFVKMMRAANIDPDSPLGRQILQGQIAKQNYVAPVNARPGTILRDPFTNKPLAFNPHVPDGTTPEFDEHGNVKSFQPIENAPAAIALSKRAEALGKAQATPTTIMVNGKPQFSTGGQDIVRAESAPTNPTNPFANLPTAQAGVIGKFDLTKDSPEAIMSTIATIQNPQERANAYAAFAQQIKAGSSGTSSPEITPSLPAGAARAADLGQDELSKKWTELNGMNAQAQTTKSYLDSIKQLAGQAAVGPFSDKLQFTNRLLSLAGSERATDATTANDLLKKYGNQIVSRLGGSGGLSTDAARAILQSAYPNEHMTKEAISEAADNLIGANAMIQAKARFVQQAAAARDPVAYQQREMLFDQAADPRLWQLQNMDAASARNYLMRMPVSVRADLQRRAAALKQAGAF